MSNAPKALDGAWKQKLRRRLLAWYAKHARVLPWRSDPHPYHVWVSEVMLQQTQVETVRAYFERFTRAFPTIAHLAAAEEQEVLRLWEGLGYYRRARSLHAAAQQVVEQHDGVLPEDVAELQRLPGIGRYTAGAIVSIAHDRPAPILEANTIRLLTRLTAYDGDPTSTAGQRYLWHVAEEVLPRKEVSRFNQALMELGSLVCRPATPLCDDCPLEKLCQAHQQQVVSLLKPTTKKTRFTDVAEVAVVVRNRRGEVLVRRCGEGERWAGLWDFPRFEQPSDSPRVVSQAIVNQVEQLTGVRCEPGERFHTLRHGVTRYRITLHCHAAQRVGGRLRGGPDLVRWASHTTLAEIPLSSTGRKIAKLLT